jgi:hypothetical protein
MSAHPGGPAIMNNHATGFVWHASRMELEQQLRRANSHRYGSFWRRL